MTKGVKLEFSFWRHKVCDWFWNRFIWPPAGTGWSLKEKLPAYQPDTKLHYRQTRNSICYGCQYIITRLCLPIPWLGEASSDLDHAFWSAPRKVRVCYCMLMLRCPTFPYGSSPLTTIHNDHKLWAPDRRDEESLFAPWEKSLKPLLSLCTNKALSLGWRVDLHIEHCTAFVSTLDKGQSLYFPRIT